MGRERGRGDRRRGGARGWELGGRAGVRREDGGGEAGQDWGLRAERGGKQRWRLRAGARGGDWGSGSMTGVAIESEGGEGQRSSQTHLWDVVVEGDFDEVVEHREDGRGDDDVTVDEVGEEMDLDNQTRRLLLLLHNGKTDRLYKQVRVKLRNYKINQKIL